MIVVATGLVGVVRGIPVASCKTSNAPPRGAVLGLYVASVARSCSIAARISGTTSGQDRLATVSNRFAISRVHLTANDSGLNTLLPKRTSHPRAADVSEPIVTAAFKTGELGLGEDEHDHECTSMASGINRRDAPHALERGGQGLRSGSSSGERSRCGARSGARGGSTSLPLDASAG